jgi:hypothetical protein
MEDHQLRSRGYLFLGIGYSLKSDEVRLQSQRQSCQKKAVEALMKLVYLLCRLLANCRKIQKLLHVAPFCTL